MMLMRTSLELAFADSAPPVMRIPRDWQGFSAERVVLADDAPYSFQNFGDSHYLALHDLKLRNGELRIEGLPSIRQRDLRDTITFVPKGRGVDGWAHPELRPNSYLAVYFDPEVLRADLGARYLNQQPKPFAYARNAALRSTLEKIQDLLVEPQVDDLHAESLCLLASLEVFGVIADEQGRLSTRQIGAVIDYVEAHLHEPIGLSDLAAAAGLSRFHFSRAFKATTGENPHAFVQKRRIDRAADLLRRGDMPIEAIAQAVGFHGAPQFRRVFRQILSTTPTHYRMQQR